MHGMKKIQNKRQKPNHEGNNKSHLWKRQESELRIWKVVSGVLQKVTAHSAIKFVKDLACRFGVPARIITDNGNQFMSRTFMLYVRALGSKISFASVTHPVSTGQAKRENAEVLRGLKTRTFDTLQKYGGRWINELPLVLWSLRTTPNRATG